MTENRYTSISVDFETHAILKRAAGGWGISRLLRNWAQTLKAAEEAASEAEDGEYEYVRRHKKLQRVGHPIGVMIYHLSPSTREEMFHLTHKRVKKGRNKK